jgi:hypothetical protein
MKTRIALLYAQLGWVFTGCYHRPSATTPAPRDCPAPDAAGMSARVAKGFYRMREDTLQGPWLIEAGVRVAALTEPVLVTDRALCERISAAMGIAAGSSTLSTGAEGDVYYRSGPYILLSPWRDYNRRAEWRNRGEWVALVVLGPDLKVLTAIGM